MHSMVRSKNKKCSKTKNVASTAQKINDQSAVVLFITTIVVSPVDVIIVLIMDALEATWSLQAGFKHRSYPALPISATPMV